jgi:hypothetical protein
MKRGVLESVLSSSKSQQTNTRRRQTTWRTSVSPLRTKTTSLNFPFPRRTRFNFDEASAASLDASLGSTESEEGCAGCSTKV